MPQHKWRRWFRLIGFRKCLHPDCPNAVDIKGADGTDGRRCNEHKAYLPSEWYERMNPKENWRR